MRYFVTKLFVTNLLEIEETNIMALLKMIIKRFNWSSYTSFSSHKIHSRGYVSKLIRIFSEFNFIWKVLSWLFLPLKFWSWQGSTESLFILRLKKFLKKHTRENNRPISIIHRCVLVACFIVSLDILFQKIYHIKKKETRSLYHVVMK